MKKLMTVVGARPQFVKAAVLSRQIAGSNVLSEVLVHTGQHFDENMSSVFFDELQIPKPDYNLGVHSIGHGAMTGRMMEAIEGVVNVEAPDGVIVYGDTNSTLAAALVAAKLHIPVFHIESGLRSFNKAMPEEINRIMTDHISSLLFCPTQESVENLLREGISSGVCHVGDIMYDASVFAKGTNGTRLRDILKRYSISEGEYIVSTIHREESTYDDHHLMSIASEISTLAAGAPVIFPVHPRIKNKIELLRQSIPKATFTDPLGYFDMQSLISRAKLIVTDSGGMQKEAYFYRVPCVTMRSETEWTETIRCGWNRLWNNRDYKPRKEIRDYGDGDAGGKILQEIEEYLISG